MITALLIVVILMQAMQLYAAGRILAYMRDPDADWRWIDWKRLKRDRKPHYD